MSSAGILNDPLVPLDFAGWLRRVTFVLRRNFAQLGMLATVPAALVAIYLVALSAVSPNSSQMQQRIDSASRSAGGRVSPATGLEVVFGPLVPIVLIFLILFILTSAIFACSAVFFVVREANGQPVNLSMALGFATTRTWPLIGWSLLTWLAMGVVLGVPLSIGLALGQGWLAALGAVVGSVLFLGLTVTYLAAVVCGVVIERSGARRAFNLIRNSFWSSVARFAMAGVIYSLYALVANGLVAFVTPSSDSLNFGVVLAAIAQGLLIIPPMIFAVSVCVVSYAGLRQNDDRTVRTTTLAAEVSR